MTTITDDEREAREWLDRICDGNKHARTVWRLLNAPRLTRPEDVPNEVIATMIKANTLRGMRAALHVHYDHYTAPPRKVEAWGIVGHDGTIDAVKLTEEDAQTWAGGRRIVRLVEDRDGE